MMSGFMILSCYSFSIVLGLCILIAIIGYESIDIVDATGNNSIIDKQTNNNSETNYLFIQSALSGSLTPVDSNDTNITTDQVHELTLNNITSSTFAFSERPEGLLT